MLFTLARLFPCVFSSGTSLMVVILSQDSHTTDLEKKR